MNDKMVILHVDDDARVREVVGEVLTRAGHVCVGVANGLDALEHVASFGAPALVLVDLTMPVMNGWQLLAERRKSARLTHVPFVALTASGALDAAELGVAEILRKPVDIDRLLAVARRYAGTGRSGTYQAITPETPNTPRVRKNDR